MTVDLNDPRAWLLTWESGDTAVWLERPNLNPEIKVQPLYLAQTPAYLEDLAQWADAAVELFPVHGERFQEIARVLRAMARCPFIDPEYELEDHKPCPVCGMFGGGPTDEEDKCVGNATDEQIETACAAYARATGYYVEFHRGLSSESSDLMRVGMRAALCAVAQTGRNRDPIYAPDGKTWYQTALDEASKRGETELRIHELEAVDESIAKQLQRSIERNSRLVNRVKHLESFCTNSAKHVTDGEVFAGHIADCCRKIALDEGTP